MSGSNPRIKYAGSSRMMRAAQGPRRSVKRTPVRQSKAFINNVSRGPRAPAPQVLLQHRQTLSGHENRPLMAVLSPEVREGPCRALEAGPGEKGGLSRALEASPEKRSGPSRALEASPEKRRSGPSRALEAGPEKRSIRFAIINNAAVLGGSNASEGKEGCWGAVRAPEFGWYSTPTLLTMRLQCQGVIRNYADTLVPLTIHLTTQIQ